MRAIVSVLMLFAGGIATFTFAQTDDTPYGGNSSSTYCPHLVQTMQRCNTGVYPCRDATTVPPGQVTELQRFLSDYYDIDPEEIVTGYFGRITESHVKRFQQENNLPAFGLVGSLTRARIAQVCGKSSLPLSCPIYSPPLCGPDEYLVGGGYDLNGCQLPPYCKATGLSSCPQIFPPPCDNGSLVSLGYNANGCHAGYKCVVSVPQSCTFNGQTIAHGQSVTAYDASTVPFGSQCGGVSETRTCNNGVLSGSYQHTSCSIASAQCVPVASPQTQTISCPSGQTGSIIQTKYSTCPSGATQSVWGDWVTTHNTCTTVVPPTTHASCTFNGQNIPHGAGVIATQYNGSNSGSGAVGGGAEGGGCGAIERRVCINGTLTGSLANIYQSCDGGKVLTNHHGACVYTDAFRGIFHVFDEGEEVNTAQYYAGLPSKYQRCDNGLLLNRDYPSTSVMGNAGYLEGPLHGNAPFTFKIGVSITNPHCSKKHELEWGDGIVEVLTPTSCPGPNYAESSTRTHTYATPGRYVIRLLWDGSPAPLNGNAVTIRVGSVAVVTPSSSQLASVLAALEGVLEKLRAYLGT